MKTLAGVRQQYPTRCSAPAPRVSRRGWCFYRLGQPGRGRPMWRPGANRARGGDPARRDGRPRRGAARGRQGLCRAARRSRLRRRRPGAGFAARPVLCAERRHAGVARALPEGRGAGCPRIRHALSRPLAFRRAGRTRKRPTDWFRAEWLAQPSSRGHPGRRGVRPVPGWRQARPFR